MVLTVLAGLLISLMLVWIGLDCLVMCKHVQQDSVRDTRYEYMYYYKYPEPEVPEGGTEAYALSLKKERFGYNLDVTLLGIGPDNPYFPLELSDRMDEVVISSAMAQKYGIREGEEVTLRDEEAGRIYAFRVAGITQYAPAFYAFMDIDALYPLFISNVACAMDLSMSPLVYVGMYAIIVGLCFVIIQALQRKIHRISPAEILKHRE